MANALARKRENVKYINWCKDIIPQLEFLVKHEIEIDRELNPNLWSTKLYDLDCDEYINLRDKTNTSRRVRIKDNGLKAADYITTHIDVEANLITYELSRK